MSQYVSDEQAQIIDLPQSQVLVLTTGLMLVWLSIYMLARLLSVALGWIVHLRKSDESMSNHQPLALAAAKRNNCVVCKDWLD